MNDDKNIAFTIGKELVTPIVETKIKEAVLSALGGGELLIEKLVDQIINQKVNSEGKVSGYSYDNKFAWLDVVVTEKIKTAVELEIKEQLTLSSSKVKEAVIKHLNTKQGINTIAKALVDGMKGTFESNWRSTVKVNIYPEKVD